MWYVEVRDFDYTILYYKRFKCFDDAIAFIQSNSLKHVSDIHVTWLPIMKNE